MGIAVLCAITVSDRLSGNLFDLFLYWDADQNMEKLYQRPHATVVRRQWPVIFSFSMGLSCQAGTGF